MEETVKQFEALIDGINEDIRQTEAFINDLKDRYPKAIKGDIDLAIQIQSQILRMMDYRSQKKEAIVQLKRQLIQIQEGK